MFKNFLGFFSLLALALLIFGSGSALAQTRGTTISAQSTFTAIQHATLLRAGETVIGALAQTQPMHVVIALKLRNQAQLGTFLANPQHAALTPAQFTTMYSPTITQAQEVAAFMRQAGFTSITIAPNRLLVSGDAPASVVSVAFHTSFVQVLTRHGRHAFANNSDVLIPAALESTVNAVLGLQNVHLAHTADVRYIPSATSMPQPAQSGGSLVGHDPTDFPIIYGDSSLALASGVPVGIITQGGMAQVIDDLDEFTGPPNNLPAVNVTVDCVTSGGCGGTDASTLSEWDLDSQDIVAMGGVQDLVLYDVAELSDADLTTAYNAAVSADAVKVINVSLEECETDAESDGSAASDDAIFEEADAQNQTFSIAAGDHGADECPGNGGALTPSYPASSPYVVAVGGTDLYTSGNTTWADETVWNTLSEEGGATGGSPSTFEIQESWQNGLGPNANSSYRGVSDIALDADPASGAEIIVDGAEQQWGGTSLSSPLFVGTWARILQAKGESLGFAAPLIYQVASDTSNYAADFHDVTSGNNNGESALTGWDYPTGLGSIIGNEFLSGLNISLGVSPPFDLRFTFISCVGVADHYLIGWSPGTGGTPSDYELYSQLGSQSWSSAYEGSQSSYGHL